MAKKFRLDDVRNEQTVIDPRIVRQYSAKPKTTNYDDRTFLCWTHCACKPDCGCNDDYSCGALGPNDEGRSSCGIFHGCRSN